MDLAVVDIYFKKKDQHRVPYKSGIKSTQVDYVMCRRRNLKEMCDRRRHRLKWYPLQVRHKQDWGRGFILLLPQTAALPELDAGSGVIKPASSSKTARPCASCGARCIGHAVRTWSAVCSEAPHSQFGEGARPHLCMDEWNRPTPVRRRLSLTQDARGKPIPTGLASVPGTKARSLEAFSQYSVFHL